MRNVKFSFVSTETCQEKVSETEKLTLKPITGTMKIHAAAWKGNSIVAVRSTSCYCEICKSASFTCDTWRHESLKNVQQKAKKMPKSSVPVQAVVETNDIYHVHEYIAANYMNKWYIGQMKDADSEDNTVEVSFLETKKAMFQWSVTPDVIWVVFSAKCLTLSQR